jgi:hypothetical protein
MGILGAKVRRCHSVIVAKFQCQIHCFFNKSKIVTNDTAIDEKSLAEHFDMMLIAESDWLQVMPLASEKCLKDCKIVK